MSLDISFDDSELKDFVKLINSVWQKIKSLDLPDISGYEQSHKGILAFEKDLIDSYDL